jgi:hypothetical protein
MVAIVELNGQKIDVQDRQSIVVSHVGETKIREYFQVFSDREMTEVIFVPGNPYSNRVNLDKNNSKVVLGVRTYDNDNFVQAVVTHLPPV